MGSWSFWVDVGGTFTDCIAQRPDGELICHKLLSSGVYRGISSNSSTPTALACDQLTHHPNRFFDGCELRLRDGQEEFRSAIVRHQGDRLILADPIRFDLSTPKWFEIISDLPAPIVGVRWLRGLGRDEPIEPCTVRLGTTRGINALLERNGARTALVTTRGFRDVLRIAYQDRPRLFDLTTPNFDVLYREVIEIDERVSARGEILNPVGEADARRQLRMCRARGIETLAIVLLHSYLNPTHEERLATIAAEEGFDHVSVSSRITPSQRIVPRGQTTVVNAYLTPLLRDYVAEISRCLPGSELWLMTSAGSLVPADDFWGKDLILSGPAGGVIGARRVAEQAGYRSAVTFDMGGTSTDVSRQAGAIERTYTAEIRDPHSGSLIRVVAPMMSIETVAAGGGSICDFDGARVTVGPRSAGANPGPACYGRGGPLTITDCQLLLGRLVPDGFSIPLDLAASRRRLDELRDRIAAGTQRTMSDTELAEGLLAVANQNMAEAIKRISIARGHDVRHDVLVSFGGAGGQHACAIARSLGIQTVVQHSLAGVLSAFGIGLADERRFGERHLGVPWEEVRPRIDDVFQSLEDEARSASGDRFAQSNPSIEVRRLLELRYLGQDATIAIDEAGAGDFAAEFQSQHELRLGFRYADRPVEAVVARVEICRPHSLLDAAAQPLSAEPAHPIDHRPVAFAGEIRSTPIFRRQSLLPGMSIAGPAVVVETTGTIVVEPGWSANVTARGDLVLEDQTPEESSSLARVASADDPVSLELFGRQMMAIAEQMGEVLRNSAMSTNVKERLDFSCAVFDRDGTLLANAPHVPVHLGAMGETVRTLLREMPAMPPGASYVTNDPFRGGSHLPDVTVVTPVFDREGKERRFFVASRAHHAEIGGISPGSMPPFARSLAEEGVLIPPTQIAMDDPASLERLRERLLRAPYPTRAVEENLADLRAQLAANARGVTLLEELTERLSVFATEGLIRGIVGGSAARMRTTLRQLKPGVHRFQDQLDDGSRIAVEITLASADEGGRAIIDFAGTSATSPGNLNANPAIVRAAVLYSLRTLIHDELPLNDGLLEPVEIRIPEGSLLRPIPDADPRKTPAVGGGNVETSQRIVDVLLGALGAAAASQGTMNNLLFGRPNSPTGRAFGYYETICGGGGAGPGFRGATALHTHMTNTRITDSEVMEARYPVRLREFSVRTGSGGAGMFPGGDGAVREIEFLEPLAVSLVTNRRTTRPFGLEGGEPGLPGRNRLSRQGGPMEDLGPFAQFQVEGGDVLRIETPGGGGYGSPSGETRAGQK